MSQTEPFRFTSYVPPYQPQQSRLKQTQSKKQVFKTSVPQQLVLQANTDISDCKSNSEEYTFKFAEKRNANANAHNLKLPNFEQLNEVTKELNTLQFEVEQQQKKMDALHQKQRKLQQTQTEIRDEIKEWHSKWQLWTSSDLVQWIFQIDGRYFDFKHTVQGQKFDKTKFEFALDFIVNRIQKQQCKQNASEAGISSSSLTLSNSSSSIGKYLVFFDVLDVKQMFEASPLDADDCRKLFHEIQTLIHDQSDSDNEQPNKSRLCSVCYVQSKDIALECGHLLCSKCVEKVTQCPFCKSTVNKKNIRKVFL